MSLSSALGIAQSSLANTAAQSALISKNIANVGNTDYSRESAGTITQLYGYVTPGATQRATDAALTASLLYAAQSASTSSSALSDGLTNIAATLGLDTSSTSSTTSATDNSPATLIGALAQALQQYAAAPDQSTLGTAAVTAAKALATNLNQASASVASVRAQADSDMAASVKTINSLLAQFQTVNKQIVAGTRTGTDVTTGAGHPRRAPEAALERDRHHDDAEFRRRHVDLHRQRRHAVRDDGAHRLDDADDHVYGRHRPARP